MLATTENPYQPPEAKLVDSAADEILDRYSRIGKLVVGWEKLRLLYNIILGTFVLLLLGIAFQYVRSSILDIIPRVVLGGIFANLCFCVGPILNGYLAWIGWGHPFIRPTLFVSGTVLTMLLAIFVIFA